MALVCEFLGIAPMGLSSVPEPTPQRQCRSPCGELVLDLLRRDTTPRNHHQSGHENAIAGVAATGGSPMPCCICCYRQRMKISLSIDDFDRISSLGPFLPT